ncbi:MAG: VOC family protein [Steroidobacteraceae bacterium]
MSESGSKFEHCVLRVKDLEGALEFYQTTMGLVEIARDGGIVYLGCGLDQNYDLGLQAGGTGVAHFAMRALEEDLDKYARRLREAGVSVERCDGAEPGQERGIRFQTAFGHTMELVVPADRRYHMSSRPAYPQRLDGITPIDCDHINIAVTDCRLAAQFLHEVLDFGISEYVEPEPDSGFWPTAFVFSPRGSVHHDVGLTRAENAPEATLHHLGWEMEGLDHFKHFLDRASRVGIRLEFGISRHVGSNNLFAYFWEPGGNRFELSCEMAPIEINAPTKVTRVFQDVTDAWRVVEFPPTFFRGS